MDQTVWALALAQVAQGADVSMMFGDGEGAHQTSGVQVASFDELRRRTPDLIHMHSVFNPFQARLALWADRQGVPYIVTPHGGVAPEILQRNPLKKAAYSFTVERRRFRRAQAITAVTDAERDEIKSFLKGRGPSVVTVPNAVPLPPASIPDGVAEDVVYLGRLDVEHKGLDRLAILAESLPEVTFGVYGKGRRGILPSLPCNVTQHPPIHGIEKWAVLKAARLYLQPSRWEAFGLSVCEAALVGTRPVLAKGLHLAATLEPAGVTTIDFEDAVEVQAAHLTDLLSQRWTTGDASALREAVRELVSPARIAEQFGRLYESIART